MTLQLDEDDFTRTLCTQNLYTKEISSFSASFSKKNVNKMRTVTSDSRSTNLEPIASRSTSFIPATDITDNVNSITPAIFLNSASQRIQASLNPTSEKEYEISSSILEVSGKTSTSISYEEPDGGDLLCILTIYPVKKITNINRNNWWMHKPKQITKSMDFKDKRTKATENFDCYNGNSPEKIDKRRIKDQKRRSVEELVERQSLFLDMKGDISRCLDLR